MHFLPFIADDLTSSGLAALSPFLQKWTAPNNGDEPTVDIPTHSITAEDNNPHEEIRKVASFVADVKTSSDATMVAEVGGERIETGIETVEQTASPLEKVVKAEGASEVPASPLSSTGDQNDSEERQGRIANFDIPIEGHGSFTIIASLENAHAIEASVHDFVSTHRETFGLPLQQESSDESENFRMAKFNIAKYMFTLLKRKEYKIGVNGDDNSSYSRIEIPVEGLDANNKLALEVDNVLVAHVTLDKATVDAALAFCYTNADVLSLTADTLEGCVKTVGQYAFKQLQTATE